MLVETAVAVNQQDFPVTSCDSDANCRRQAGADRAKIDWDVVLVPSAFTPDRNSGDGSVRA